MSMIGKILGNFEITSQLGKGGMGEVYQAKDRKLGRDVAIKVLPEEFAKDADRVARFQREAKLVASLNHPNIAAIHGLEEFEGTDFLVLELVEGETLADQIARGPIPMEESLKLALQIAEALEAAHEKGVIHRDLKPANIKVTPEDKVKVLDFGLAKAFAGDQEDMNLSNSPTLSAVATQQGLILGTASYMSPEQARGRAVDKRTDIWAFGCLLYEMLSGKCAFQGEDVSEILASVIKGDVDFALLPAKTATRLQDLLGRCLKKELKQRYQDIGDVRIELERVTTDPQPIASSPAAATGMLFNPRMPLAWIAAVAMIAALIGGMAIWKFGKAELLPVIRFSDVLPSNQILTPSLDADRLTRFNPALAISADGRQLIYSTTEGLYLRSLNQSEAKIIPGTEGKVASPFFSPDGQWVGFWSASDKRLKKISVAGGSPVALCDAGFVGYATWNPDNTIVFDTLIGDIRRVSADGGTPALLFKGISMAPQVLPDGKTLLFVAGSPLNRQNTVTLLKLDSGKQTALFKGEYARYLPTGHLIYIQDPTLFAVPFDLKSGNVTGGPVPLISDIARNGIFQIALSDSGTLAYLPKDVYRTRSPILPSSLVWVDRVGKEEAIKLAPDLFLSPRLSPDGTSVAVTVGSREKKDIWIYHLVRKTMTRLTFNEKSSYPLWTIDGKRIVFAGSRSIYWKLADGTQKEALLGEELGLLALPGSWARDGKHLLASIQPGGGMSYIAMLATVGKGKAQPLLRDTYLQWNGRISRDGRWLAYASDESGKFEVFVRPFPDVNAGKLQVSTNGGDNPLWSPDGRELYYHSGEEFVAVPIKTTPELSMGSPKILFRGNYQEWDMDPDGRRFLMTKPSETAASGQKPAQRIEIIVNWSQELKRLMTPK